MVVVVGDCEEFDVCGCDVVCDGVDCEFGECVYDIGDCDFVFLCCEVFVYVGEVEVFFVGVFWWG